MLMPILSHHILSEQEMFMLKILSYLISRSDQDAEGAEVPAEGLGRLVQPLRQITDGRGFHSHLHFSFSTY